MAPAVHPPRRLEAGVDLPPPVAMIYDPTAPKVHIDPPAAYLAPRLLNSATFTINDGHAGFTNWWGDTCMTFPEAAKAAFNAAAAVWVSLLTTPVPNTIQVC